MPETTQTKHHFFWKGDSPFSQWHPSEYALDGYHYSSAEQGMMHGKALLFGDAEIADQILKTTNPRRIKKLGRKVAGFSEQEWEQHREAIVYRNNTAKFTQNDNLLKALMGTTGLLVEASPFDTIWGIGMHEREAKGVPKSEWKGLNLLGKTLTRVREDIRSGKASLSLAPEEETALNGDNKAEGGKGAAPLPEGTKTVYMIRHGQSEGQTASRKDRKTSSALRDCGLTRKGRQQAAAVAGFFPDVEEYKSIELVVSSPLTRALHTSLLAFPRNDIIVNYDLRELGSGIPENQPRKMKEVAKDLRRALDARDEDLTFDTRTLQPPEWPNNYAPNDGNKTAGSRVPCGGSPKSAKNLLSQLSVTTM